MRTHLKILILTILIFLIGISNAYAANSSVTLKADKTQVKAGDTVIVKINVKNETGIEALDSVLTYDKTKLELLKIEAGTHFTDLSGESAKTGKYQVRFLYNGQAEIKEATIGEIAFKVLENVNTNEKMEINLTSMQINDTKDEWINVNAAKETLVVASLQNDENPEIGSEPGSGTGEGSEIGEGSGTGEQSGNQGSTEGNNNTQNNNDEELEDNKTLSGENKNSLGANQSENNNTNKSNETTNNKKDNTVANKPIDKTGLSNYLIIIVTSLISICLASYIGYKKYKNI